MDTQITQQNSTVSTPSILEQAAQAVPNNGTVVFLCPIHVGIRNMVHTGIVAQLHARNIRVHLIVGKPQRMAEWYPDHKQAKSDETKLQQNFEDVDDWSELVGPKLINPLHGAATLGALQSASFYRRFHLTNERSQGWWYRRNVSGWERTRNTLAEVFSYIGSRQPLYKWQNEYMVAARRRMYDLEPLRQELRALKPSLVVATCCVIWAEEAYVLAAHDLGIPTLGCIQSFDNLTSRSTVARCDYFAVWNQRMRDQLLELHSDWVGPSEITISGTPQFDFHIRDEFRWTREETLGKLNLGPQDRYILYAANSHHQTPTEPELIAEFARRCAQSPTLRTHKIVVRMHPQDDFIRWENKFTDVPNVVICQPTIRSWFYSGPQDQSLLVNSLRYADVSINMWSTMSLDSAVVDTPVVCVGFAMEPGSQEDQFCRTAYEADFYVPIIQSGGVRLVHDMERLVGEVEAYVGDRSRDQVQRKNLVTTECGPVDGKIADRVADLITGLVISKK